MVAAMNELELSHTSEISDEGAASFLWELGIHYLRGLRYQHSLAEHQRTIEWLQSDAGFAWLSIFGIRSESICDAIDRLGRRTLIGRR